VFIKVKKQGTMPHAILSPTFGGLGHKDKKLFLNAAVAYYAIVNLKADFLILKNPLNGKAVSTFSNNTGLDLD